MNATVFTILVAPVSATVMGFTAAQYWQWFVVPLGAPSIGFAHAVALVMGARIALAHRPRSVTQNDTLADAAQDFAFNCFAAMVLLAIGWALSWWMQ